MGRGILLTKDDDSGFDVAVTDLEESALPAGDLLVDVEYSTVNYKDALALTDSSPIVRTWPMVPGIDLAGSVRTSDDDSVAAGARVVVNGWGLGETRWGGLATIASVDASMVVPIPDSITTERAMGIGTAGYTAMLCVLALESNGCDPDAGPVLVTGATGGVGSIAVALLAKLGFEVVASTGKADERAYLTSLGAASVIDRAELAVPGKPLQKAVYAGAVDVAGSVTLANVCAQVQPFGTVAACGLAQGMDFPSSVAPFILRGVTLAGIDSVYQPAERRIEAWARLATDLPADTIDSVVERIPLAEAPAAAQRLLDGEVRGRLVVDVHAG